MQLCSLGQNGRGLDNQQLTHIRGAQLILQAGCLWLYIALLMPLDPPTSSRRDVIPSPVGTQSTLSIADDEETE